MDKTIKTCILPKYRIGQLSNGEQVEVPINCFLDAGDRNWNYKQKLKDMLYKSQHSEATKQLVEEWENFYFNANMEIVEYWSNQESKAQMSLLDRIKLFFGGKK